MTTIRRAPRWTFLALSLANPLLVPAAAAQEPTAFSGEFLNLSYTGDGATPSALALFQSQERKLATPRTAVDASDRGDAGYSVPVELPPALFAPTVQLTYSSLAGRHSAVGRGWSLDVGMTLQEIRGSAASHAYQAHGPTYRLAGAGLNGLLYRTATGWQFVSTDGAAVDARIVDNDGRFSGTAWLVRHGGVTTLLVADQDLVATPGARRTEWRAVLAWDAQGNAVRWHYTGNRLDHIDYGGTVDADGNDALPPLWSVQFDYVAAPAPSYRAQDGYVDVIADRLAAIRVLAPGHASPLVRSIRLTHELRQDEPYLASLDLADDTGTVNVARFEYAAWTDQESAAESRFVDAAPSTLGDSATSTTDASTPSATITRASFSDVSGDGLPDVWSDACAGWDCPDAEDPVDYAVSVRCSEFQSKSATVRRLIDLDGDGFNDLVESLGVVPEPYYPGYSAPEGEFCESPETAGEPTPWRVWYGPDFANLGADGGPLLVDAPVGFPRVGASPFLKDIFGDNAPERLVTDDTFVDLIDFDGDGWLDIAHTRINDAGLPEIAVWFHTRDERVGWTERPVIFEHPTSDGSNGTVGFDVQVQHIEILETLPAGANWYQMTPTIASVDQVQGLRDLNGDGLVDLVDARGWDEKDASYWLVYLGTGRRSIVKDVVEDAFDPVPIEWDAPTGTLAVTDEGVPLVVSCHDAGGRAPSASDMGGEWVGSAGVGEMLGIRGGGGGPHASVAVFVQQ